MNKIRRFRIGCTIFLIWVLVMLLGGEWFLRTADPLGGYRYYGDLSRLFAGYVVSERGYSMYPGIYQFSNWTALIERDGNRHTPASKDSACKIAFVGDSVTFGFGVSDPDTFVNLIAAQVNAQIVNTAIPAYNSVNIRQTIDTYPATGYVYVVISNDDEPTKLRQNINPIEYHFNQDIFGVYVDALMHLNGDFPRDSERFNTDIAALMARDDMLMVGFKDAGGWYKRLPDSIPTMPFWTHGNSFIDGHPNPEGHREIAASLLPYVQEFERRVCSYQTQK